MALKERWGTEADELSRCFLLHVSFGPWVLVIEISWDVGFALLTLGSFVCCVLILESSICYCDHDFGLWRFDQPGMGYRHESLSEMVTESRTCGTHWRI